MQNERTIVCGTHGEVLPAYVCAHLAFSETAPLGFNQPDLDPGDTEAQAWCDGCDAVLEKHGEWNEESEAFADIRLVCEFCFAALRERHQHSVAGS